MHLDLKFFLGWGGRVGNGVLHAEGWHVKRFIWLENG